MPLLKGHLEALSVQAARLGIWDGTRDELSDLKILHPLLKITDRAERGSDAGLLAQTLECLYFVRAGGRSLRSYYNAGGHHELAQRAKSPSTVIERLAATTVGKLVHCMAGIDDPGNPFTSNAFRRLALRYHGQVTADGEALPLSVPLSGRFSESHPEDLEEVVGEGRPVRLRNTLFRPHRYLISLNVSLAAQGFGRSDLRSVRGYLLAAEREFAQWKRRGIRDGHAFANLAAWNNAIQALNVLTDESSPRQFEALVRDGFLGIGQLRDVPPAKRLLWTAGAHATLVACAKDGASRSQDIDAALSYARELLHRTRGRAAMSLENDAHFVLARKTCTEFRAAFADLLKGTAILSGDPRQADPPTARPARGSSNQKKWSWTTAAVCEEAYRLHQGKMIQKDIAQALGVDQATVSRILKKMRTLGRPVQASDRRRGVKCMRDDILDAGARTHPGGRRGARPS